MITEISLTNFKKHESLDLTFPPGLTLIRGENAAGKSTILKAILFALYGSQAAGDKSHLKRRGADKMEVGVRAALPERGDVRFSRNEKSASVTSSGGDNLASGHTPVTAFLEETLGMDQKTLRLLTYSPQGEAQGLLAMGATLLQKKIEDIAKVDVLDRVLSRLNTDISRMTGEMDALQPLPDLGEIRGRLEDAQQGYASVSQALVDARRELQGAIALRGVHEANYKDAGVNNTAVRGLVSQRATLEDRIIFLNRELNKLPPATESLQELQGRRDQAKDFVDDLSSLIAQAHRAETRRERAEQDRVQTAKAIAEIEMSLSKWRGVSDRFGELTALFVDASGTLSSERDALRDLRSKAQAIRDGLDKSVCHACRRPFDAREQGRLAVALRELEKGIAQQESAVNDLCASVESLSSERAGLLRMAPKPSSESDLAKLREDLAAFAAQASESVPDMADLKSRLEQAQAEHTDAVLALDRALKVSKDRGERTAELQKAREDLAAVCEDLNGRVEIDLGPLNQALTNALKQERVIAQMVVALQAKLEGLESLLDRLGRELVKAEETHEREKTLSKELELHKRLQVYLKDNRTRFSGDLWENLTNYASALLDTVSQGTLTNLTRKSDGDFWVDEGEVGVPVAELSGAQRTMVGLCLRIALTKVFYGDGLVLLLDEVTDSMSDTNAAAVASLLSGVGMQVIMVSHRSGDATNCANVICIGEDYA